MGAAAAVLIVVLGLVLPLLKDRLHLEPLPLSVWVVTVSAAPLLPSWWELWKRWRPDSPAGSKGTSSPATTGIDAREG